MRVGIRHVEEICISNFSCFLLTSWSIVYLAKGVISVVFGGVYKPLASYQALF